MRSAAWSRSSCSRFFLSQNRSSVGASSLEENPTTASMPGSVAIKCDAHCSTATIGTASILFSTTTNGFRNRRVTCAYNAGGKCNIGFLASTTTTATSARSSTRHNCRHTSIFCSNAGAYPPASIIASFARRNHATNALRSLACNFPRFNS